MKKRVGRIASVAVLLSTVPFLATACFALPAADASFEQKIPAALEGAGLGLSDVWASRSTSGFSVILNVGGTSASGEVSADELRQMLKLIADNNTLGGDRLDFSLRTADDSEFVDLDGPAQELGAAPQVSASDGPLGIDMAWDAVNSLLG